MVLWGDLPNLRDMRYLLIQIWVLGTANCLKNNFIFLFFLKIYFLLNTCWNNFISDSFHLRTQRKNKVYNWDKWRRYIWKICARHIWPNLAGQMSPWLFEDPRGRRFWAFLDQIFWNDFKTKFFNVKTLFRGHSDAKVFLAKFQSRLNVK